MRYKISLKGITYLLAIIFQTIITISYAQEASDGQNIADVKIKGSSDVDDAKVNISKYSSIDYYRGAVKFSLPIYTATEKNLEIPIILNYEGSGTKVDQTPTWVGLGFSLSAGGFITRNLKGTYDERSAYGYINAKNWSNGQVYADPSTYNAITNTFTLNSQLNNVDYKWWCIGCELDSQPDEYILQLPGISTVFYLNREGIPIGTTKFKITYSYDRTLDYPMITAWQVVADNGITYQFQQQEKSWSVFAGNTWRCHGGQSPNVPITWYLTKIISADNKNSIDLVYENDGSGFNRFRQFASEFELKNTYYYASNGATTQSSAPESYSFIPANGNIESIYLAKISTSNLNISFERTESNSAFERRELSKIKIKTKANEVLKTYLFSYKPYMGLGLDGTTPAMNGRFLLTSMQETSELNGQIFEQIPPFKFIYDETPIAAGGDTAQDPQICGVDHWGYYTGPKPAFESRLPLNVILGLAPTFYGVGDRSPNPTYMKAGSLSKVILSSGGSIQFEYEPHDYSYVSNGTIKSNKITAGGLRIKRIINSDGVSSTNDIIRTFTYQSAFNSQLSSGVIENEPVYYFPYASQSTVGGFRPFSTELWSDDPISPIDIGYSTVTETFDDNSFKTYNYLTSLDYPYSGFPEDISYVDHNATYFSRYDHPLFKNHGRYNYMRGLLVQETNYNNNGNLVGRTKLSYQITEIDKLFAMERVTEGSFPNTGGLTGTLPLFIHFSRNYYVPIGKSDLIKTEKFVYDPDMDQDAISPILAETILYEYNPLNYKIAKQTTYESNGDIVIDYFKYPLDYGAISASTTGYVKGIKNLQDGNIISLPVEQYRVRQSSTNTNPRVISGSLNLFKDTQPYLDQVQKLNVSTPIPFNNSTFQSSVSGNTILKNSNYKTEQVIEAYDNYGNPASVIKRDQVRECYLWGNNGSLLIAAASKAKATEIFYTSFEDSDGNSTIGDCKTGKKSKLDGYSKTLSSITAGLSYYLTYFRKEGGVWVFHRDFVNAGSSTYQITLTGQIDEVRFYPQDALMTTYTYDPFYGLVSTTDQNNVTTYVDYDSLGRKRQIRNNKGNIETTYSYYYQGN